MASFKISIELYGCSFIMDIELGKITVGGSGTAGIPSDTKRDLYE